MINCFSHEINEKKKRKDKKAEKTEVVPNYLQI